MDTGNQVTIKVILIGDSGVGKSSLLRTFMGEPFSNVYTSTIGVDFEMKIVQVGDTKVHAQIWDTAGQERFRTITNSYYRSSHAVLLCFDVTDINTFHSLNDWLQDINSEAHPNVGIVVCGNKVDAVADREVSYEVAKMWADGNNLPYFEMTATDTQRVDHVFIELFKAAIERLPVNQHHAAAAAVSMEPTKVKSKSKGCC